MIKYDFFVSISRPSLKIETKEHKKDTGKNIDLLKK